jgi:hypothetical protein
MKQFPRSLTVRALACCGAIFALPCTVPSGLAAAEIPARALTPPAFPTEVYISLYGVEVFEIDEQQETFVIEADLAADWQDPRLAWDASGEAGGLPLVFEEEAASDLLKTIWWPNFELSNGRGSRDRMHLSIEIVSDGTVAYHERFSAVIKQNLSSYLDQFPFDYHDISFQVLPFSAGGSEVVFLPMQEEQEPIRWEPSDWSIADPELVVRPGWICSGSGEVCSPGDECPAGESCDAGWASAAVSMSIFRVTTHYVWKIILPLTLIVLVSSAVFWLDLVKFPDPGDRLAISFTGVLTVVAFDFVSSGSLPKLWYMTVLDKILVMAYIFLAINIALNVASTQLSTVRPALSRRVDLVGRWVFPLAFLICLWAVVP